MNKPDTTIKIQTLGCGGAKIQTPAFLLIKGELRGIAFEFNQSGTRDENYQC
jgi:hypothetical protein